MRQSPALIAVLLVMVFTLNSQGKEPAAEKSPEGKSGTHGTVKAPFSNPLTSLDSAGEAFSPEAEAHSKDGSVAGKPRNRPDALRIVVKGALERLKEGNQRFVNDKPGNPRRSKDRRALVAKAQIPFAVVVGCSDSRVPPEILFDQGLGDLFVIRVAGNVVDDPALGSIEYAVEHLGAHLIVVLGHERCGAVDAACKGGDPGGHIGSLVQAIKPAVENARKKKGNLLEEAVNANVRMVTDQLKGSWPILGPMVREDEIAVVGAVYDLETGAVDFLP